MASVVNNLLTIAMITKEALRVLENSLTFLRNIDRQFDNRFAVEGAKIGTTLNVRKPPKYQGRLGQQLSLEPSIETQVPLVLDTQFGVDIQFSSADLALNIDDFSDRFLKAAIAVVANKMDSDATSLYYRFYQVVGTPGSTPNALLTYLLAGVALDNAQAPRDGQRGVFLTPLMQAYIVDALKALFQQATEIAKQYMKGIMGTAAGFDWFMDQNITTHTIGTYGGSPVVNGAGQQGATLITNGWTATTTILNRGDAFTIAGVFMVNSTSKNNVGTLQQFVCTDTVQADGSGNLTIFIDPPITTAGAFQTVTASPANGAVITVFGASGTATPQGIAMHRDAMTFASADLPIPRGVDMAGRASDDQLGISIRMVRAYDINSDNFPMRLDVLYGLAVLRPELGCRIAA